ncbi:MAG: hypothetical protein IT497_02845 [Ottowia sp.]|nr:hypothetical protein [Ottowia sp.]
MQVQTKGTGKSVVRDGNSCIGPHTGVFIHQMAERRLANRRLGFVFLSIALIFFVGIVAKKIIVG